MIPRWIINHNDEKILHTLLLDAFACNDDVPIALGGLAAGYRQR